MVLRKILWFYGEKNYDTIQKTMELLYTMENNYGTLEKLWYYD